MDKKLYGQLNYEVTNLHYRWIVFRNVYAVSKDQINLLNEIDSSFFGIVQNLYWESIILCISRLTDKEITGKANRNLSLYTLFNDVSKEMDLETKSHLDSKLQQIKELSNNLRYHRSKKIAHTDYNYAIDKKSYELDGISRKDIEDILNAIREFMNIINGYYFNNTTLYELIPSVSGGTDLVYCLTQKKEHTDELV